jgi:hypothetical protein
VHLNINSPLFNTGFHAKKKRKCLYQMLLFRFLGASIFITPSRSQYHPHSRHWTKAGKDISVAITDSVPASGRGKKGGGLDSSNETSVGIGRYELALTTSCPTYYFFITECDPIYFLRCYADRAFV